MADTDDALKHFVSSADDPYQLLDLPNGPASTEKEIRSAWKKSALRYHPDKRKNGTDEATANRLYILRQDAYGVLSEPHLREQYDNALRAKEQKRERDAAFDGRRKAMKEDLERRESGAFKRKREVDHEEEMMERELARLKEDGLRRRRERAEMLRREAEEDERRHREEREGVEAREIEPKTAGQVQIEEIDRSVRSRWPQSEETVHLNRERVIELFSRFGPVEEAILRDKKVKVEGDKHRRPFITVVLVYQSIVGAHAAVSDFEKAQASEAGDWKLVEAPTWAGGQEPECIPKPQQAAMPSHPSTPTSKVSHDMERLRNATASTTPRTPADGNKLKKVPSFGSFRATPTATINSPGLDEITTIRLKNAERRRMEEKIRKEDEAAAGDGAAKGLRLE